MERGAGQCSAGVFAEWPVAQTLSVACHAGGESASRLNLSSPELIAAPDQQLRVNLSDDLIE